MIFFRIRNYLKYLFFWGHRNGHGIHSPYVFYLVSQVFRNKINAVVVFKIENIRKKLISGTDEIKVRDLGSGAGNNEIRIRRVKEIARYSPVTKKYGIFLARMASEFGGKYIVELGTSFGISTMYMAGASPDSVIYSVEGSQSIATIAAENFNDLQFNNIRLLNGSFEEHLPAIMDLPGNPGLVFIDGNHRKEAVLRYFSAFCKKSDSRTVIVFDDIRYSPEMEEAWEIIKKDERASFTLDIWRMGIVFFKKGITSGNYNIRY